ncbi:MAG: Glu-tRNA(Gln) amidotransferase subunit GatE [Candidatus Kapabacteria bacterium]|nr:Glu-tRNA(Gln) amidotransferase subunit GatE [Candidatus Kapabacteria bacterium]
MYDFIFKPFEEMTEEDYARVGFKSGLEVHQQLLTKKKLFCRCPAGLYSDEYHAEILRHMRPTLSELGEYDGTALMEFKTKKDIIYRINRTSVCTYEMDDTPPFPMNEEALDIAIELGLLMNCHIVDELHIARKQYLDGSIPTGFQRTAIVSVGGFIPYKNREINLIQMSIEEDSCRETYDFGHTRIYITDRLGMPLTETVTFPEMFTPFEVAEVNNIIRRIARSTGKVRTGIGAAREDVNVSVTGGTRIEIKGVPKIKNIPLLTYNEAMRQWNLLRLREELHRRGITKDSFEAKFEEITKLLQKTSYQPIANAIAEGKIVNCVVLRGFKGLLRWQTQTDTYFSKEISDRVRVIACLSNIPNIIHSDSLGDTITSSEWQKIKKTVGATEDDSLVLVWGNETDAKTGANEIIIRAREATEGVPSETRQALRDGTNGFERILPGPDRMYPDTDLPPMKITSQRIEKIKLSMPAKLWERESWYKELNVPEDIIPDLAISKFANLFEKAVKEYELDPALVAVVLINYPKKLKKKRLNINLLTEQSLRSILEAYKNKMIEKDGIILAMERTILQGQFTLDILPTPATDIEIMDTLLNCKLQMNKVKLLHPEKATEILIGLVMNKLRGRVDGSYIAKYINDLMTKGN